MSSTYPARAKRWEHGWEVHVDGLGVTQCRMLADAQRQAEDFVETMTGERAVVTVAPEVAGFDPGRVSEVKAQAAAAAAMAAEAADAMRAIVKALRSSGVSVSDAASLLGVSRGRISQLS